MLNWIMIDVERVRANFLSWAGERLTDTEISDWLTQLGLRAHPDGHGWVADDTALAGVQNCGMIDYHRVRSAS